MQSARVLAAAPFNSALTRGTNVHIACFGPMSDPDTDGNSTVVDYTEGTLSTLSFRVEYQFTTGGRCHGALRTEDGYLIVASPDEAIALHVSKTGVVSAIEEIETLNTYSITRGEVLYSDISSPVYFSATDALNRRTLIWGRHPSGAWHPVFDREQGPPAMTLDGGPVLTTRMVNGLINLTTGDVVTIADGHRGLELHTISEGLYGWISVNESGEVFYSTGNSTTGWSTEATGYTDASTFTGTNLADVRVDIATNPTDGSPLFVYGASNGDFVYLVKKNGTWYSGVTPVGSMLLSAQDLKASWVGCGRPAAELVPNLPEDGGWFLFELQ